MGCCGIYSEVCGVPSHLGLGVVCVCLVGIIQGLVLKVEGKISATSSQYLVSVFMILRTIAMCISWSLTHDCALRTSIWLPIWLQTENQHLTPDLTGTDRTLIPTKSGSSPPNPINNPWTGPDMPERNSALTPDLRTGPRCTASGLTTKKSCSGMLCSRCSSKAAAATCLEIFLERPCEAFCDAA